jgi:hypothetical protein
LNRPGRGWTIFAAVVLMIAGAMRIFDSIWAFRYNGVVSDDLESALLGHNLETYGWVFLIVGLILIGSGILALRGSEIGRWVGAGSAALLCVSAAWWMPYYPVWSLTYIGIGILVIVALVVHGGDDSELAANRSYTDPRPTAPRPMV